MGEDKNRHGIGLRKAQVSSKAWLSSSDTSTTQPAVKVDAKSEQGRVLAWVEAEGPAGDVYLTFSVLSSRESINTVTSPEELRRALLVAAEEKREEIEGLELLVDGWLAEAQTWSRDNPDRFPKGWPLGKASRPEAPIG